MHHGARRRTVAHGQEALSAQLRTDKKRSAHGLRTDGKRPAHPCARWRTLAHGGVLLRKVAHGGAQTVRTVAHPCARMRKHIFQLHVLYCCSVVLVLSIGYLNTSVLPPPCQGQNLGASLADLPNHNMRMYTEKYTKELSNYRETCTSLLFEPACGWPSKKEGTWMHRVQRNLPRGCPCRAWSHWSIK